LDLPWWWTFLLGSLALWKVGRKAVLVDLKSAFFANDAVPTSGIWVGVTEMQAHRLFIKKITAKRTFDGHCVAAHVSIHSHYSCKLIDGERLRLLNPL